MRDRDKSTRRYAAVIHSFPRVGRYSISHRDIGYQQASSFSLQARLASRTSTMLYEIYAIYDTLYEVGLIL